MARLGVSKKKKSPRATEVSQLKKEVQRLTEQLESRDRDLTEALEQQTATGESKRVSEVRNVGRFCELLHPPPPNSNQYSIPFSRMP